MKSMSGHTFLLVLMGRKLQSVAHVSEVGIAIVASFPAVTGSLSHALVMEGRDTVSAIII